MSLAPTIAALSSDWVKIYDEDEEKYYYYDNISHESSWEMPKEFLKDQHRRQQANRRGSAHRKAVKFDPTETRQQRWWRLLRENVNDLALSRYERALKINPDDGYALAQLGRQQYRLGDIDLAVHSMAAVPSSCSCAVVSNSANSPP